MKVAVLILYNSNDNIIAYYYKLDPVGYIIIDSNTYGIIEFSTITDNKYIVNDGCKYYYSGPLSYLKTNSSNNIVDCRTGEIIDKINISFDSKTKFDKTAIAKQNSITANSISLTSSANTALSYLTRTYNYNINNNCASVAAAIFFAYYYDYIDKSYALPNYITSDGKTFINLLISFIEPNHDIIDGTFTTQVVDGMNRYLESILHSKNIKYVTTWNILTTPYNKVKQSISNGNPAMVSLANHTTYGYHWVVAHGYSNSDLLKYITVNDGWGNLGINISESYLYSTIYTN